MTIEQDDTRDLVERALGGDRAAFDDLCRAWQNSVLATVRRMIGRATQARVDPDDVMQDVWSTAWTSLGDFEWRGAVSFRQWLEGIARHRVLHLSRREQRRDELLLLHRPAPDATSPSGGARREERFERLKDAVDGLRPEYRKVLRLARIEGRSIREIATSLEKSESAVKNLLLRAMKALRDVLPETESLTLPRDRRIGETSDGPNAQGESGGGSHGS